MSDRRLRFGILGAARIAQTHLVPGIMASTLTEVRAIASRDIHKARAIASEMEIPRAHGSYAALLADPEIDAVYIPLPNSLHAEWTIEAARAGKHVLCEKPVAARAADAERMRNACEAAGVILMEAFMWRHHPQHQRVRQLLTDGAIGEPTFVRSTFTYVLDPGPPSDRNVRLEAQLEGGSLMDVGCYGVNAARWVFQSEPDAVAGLQLLASGIDMDFAGILRFGEERLAAIDSSFARPFTNSYVIEGREGKLIVDRAFRPDTDPGKITIQRRGREPRVEEVPPANQYAHQVDHFARSVEAGRLLPPAEDGVAQARVIEALYASATQPSAVE
jgi:D-xylose 1-dehydrogenase (NADP+, D-xylono-1,5-lactone-forming)